MGEFKYKCMTKGTNREKGEPRTSQNWIASKRGSLKIYDSLITLGSWEFETQNIENPVMYNCRSFPIPAKVLAFDYKDKHYQFGLNPWVNPLPHLSFTPKIENVKMKYSLFSIILRVSVFAFLLYRIIIRLLR